MAPNTVCATRPGKWGNPYFPGCGIGYGSFTDDGRLVLLNADTPEIQVKLFRLKMEETRKHFPDEFEKYIAPLRGKNLACWCALCPRHRDGKPFGEPCADCAPCHTDVLGEIANAPILRGGEPVSDAIRQELDLIGRRVRKTICNTFPTDRGPIGLHGQISAADFEVLMMLARGCLSHPPAGSPFHKLDNDKQIFFYEQDFYVFSNFSAFRLHWKGKTFDTSEAAYHYEKFPHRPDLQEAIISADSAHVAFKFAEMHKADRRADWDDVKVDVMREILREKVKQHGYVRYKLLQSGNRELIEDSWRDPFWGWGPNRDGQNMLGKLWMEVREEVRNEPEPMF